MFREGLLDKILYKVKRLIPKRVFDFFAPSYHWLLAWGAAIIYRFPSHSMKVIGVTGTKGKSTTVFFISKILEAGGHKVAAIGSLGYKIGDREWPNTLKMTMPGRFRIQKFLAQAKKAGCGFVVLEVTSEGLAQGRHNGIRFDCAVFTNLHPEHIESHGSLENYISAKQKLFLISDNTHVINADDPRANLFGDLPAKRKIFYGLHAGEMMATNIKVQPDSIEFSAYGTQFAVSIGGEFNVYNCLAALAVGAMYGVDLPTARPALQSIPEVAGRMQFIQKSPFTIVVDYAHTPDSLEAVYKALKPETGKPVQQDEARPSVGRLICVLGAAGGGRDTWKRPKFGAIAAQYCDKIILADEDPWDENQEEILNQIEAGIPENQKSKVERILDRRQAIRRAVSIAQPGDVVVITGKGSEVSLALANGKKIPWSDAKEAREALQH
ncbi:MAG: UDP-N-acetylmuramoyl-L-alanyl-D-glutamate--2,6-diaminopimelate ligase [Patescibacteria group bacterium]